MDEDVVGQLILRSQRKTIQGSVIRISLADIYIVYGESNLLAQSLVVQHENDAVEQLKLVVPKNVKDLRLGCRGVTDQLRVVGQDPVDFSADAGIRSLITSQIQKVHPGIAVKLLTIKIITPNQIQAHSLCDQFVR
jgi:hypothetical protein